jgi:putative FmdB family regulatory protein
MPLFEYECQGCGNKFEVLVGVGQGPQRGSGAGVPEDPQCPKCGGGRVEKCLSVFAVSVKSGSPAAGACAACPHANSPTGCGMVH